MAKGNGKMCVLLFAGTSEGRILASYLGGLSIDTYVSTATEYGLECVENIENIQAFTGRMDEEAIGVFITEHKIQLVVDATHPFARIVTENIQSACRKSDTAYLRCLRENGQGVIAENERIIMTQSVEEAVQYLKCQEGNIFISTGSKELKLYTEIENYKERCYARVLSTMESVAQSTELGFKGAHLIAMQGPFSKELNIAMIVYTNAKYFVTKESGKTGGFEEKVEAARQAGVTLVVIGRPKETGYSIDEVKGYIQNILKTDRKGV